MSLEYQWHSRVDTGQICLDLYHTLCMVEAWHQCRFYLPGVSLCQQCRLCCSLCVVWLTGVCIELVSAMLFVGSGLWQVFESWNVGCLCQCLLLDYLSARKHTVLSEGVLGMDYQCLVCR